MKKTILSWLFFFLLFPLCDQATANYKGDGSEIKFKNLRELSLNDLKIVDSGGSTKIEFNGQKIYESGWRIHSAPGEPIEIQKPRLLYAEHNGRRIIVISESGVKCFNRVLIIRNGKVKSHFTNFSQIKKVNNYI